MTALQTAKQIYDNAGFIVFRNVWDTDTMTAALADAIRVEEAFKHLKHTNNRRCRWQDNVLTGDCQFDAFDPIIDLSPVCETLARSEVLARLLETIYGEPACLFKDKLIYKHPGAKGYGLHQDWIAWERFPQSFLSVVVPLEEADDDNGCTVVYPGLHKSGPLTPTDGNYRELPESVVEGVTPVSLILKPGDVAVFSGFTPHKSQANLSNRSRRQLYFSFTKYSDGGDLRTQHYQDFQEWLEKKYREYGKTETYFA